MDKIIDFFVSSGNTLPLFFLAIFLILKDLYSFLKSRKSVGCDDIMKMNVQMLNKIEEFGARTDELHKWHNKTDEYGVFLWYNQSKAIADAMRELSEVTRQNMQINEKMLVRLEIRGEK